MKINMKWIVLLLAAGALAFFFWPKPSKTAVQTTKEVSPRYGSIETVITATAVIQPQNRLEIKPPVAGRVDKILVQEGDGVKAGQTVAFMSSSERAALLDAARARGETETAYWEQIYKPILLIAPIDGTVIVSTMQPGQTVTQTDPVVVLSDRLIVQAQIDETDIGKVREGQEAVVTLDAYPDVEVKASVSHIFHESKVVNNVTIYQVDLVPQEIPDVFRSGMTANVRIVREKKENALLLPLEAVKRPRGEDSFVLVSEGRGAKPSKREVKLGMSDETNVEVVSGVGEKDTVVFTTQKFQASRPRGGTNPLMPSRPRRNTSNRPAS